MTDEVLAEFLHEPLIGGLAVTPLARHAEIDGDAIALHPEQFDICPVSTPLANKYVGQDGLANRDRVVSFVRNMQTKPRLLFRIKPLIWRAIDLTVYRGKKADRDFQKGRSD